MASEMRQQDGRRDETPASRKAGGPGRELRASVAYREHEGTKAVMLTPCGNALQLFNVASRDWMLASKTQMRCTDIELRHGHLSSRNASARSGLTVHCVDTTYIGRTVFVCAYLYTRSLKS